MRRPDIKSICIFCGSLGENSRIYAEAARSVARLLTEKEVTLVYGGARTGLMGVLADTALSAGGKVVGVIPQELMEFRHPRLTQTFVVKDMHQRKAQMARMADAFIALPGGLGTMEELFETWTWSQLGIHSKPCGLMNVAGFYDNLLAQTETMLREGFVLPCYRQILIAGDDPEELMEKLHSFETLSPKREWVT
ncbi:TIGR00730 family Rossman fold protein [Streptomyces sp. ICN441]|uniref:LOG family protein n=1 Tax=Streptomyces sp. ICN441 TaxID=2558286 RepID=UPI00106C432A|nr:TIGR00730 family Rossman fold protein [Streptomyces sp. ICN441]TFE50456.1 TIGR00730 family Rossman fold protein [Streptomyces sp. ICN441]